MAQENKKGQTWDHLIPWLIFFLVLALVIGFFITLKVKGVSGLEFLKNLIKFR